MIVKCRASAKCTFFGIKIVLFIVYNSTAKHQDNFRDTLIAKKYGEGEDRTHDLLAGKAISEVHFTRWSGDKVEFWQNLKKKRVNDHDFPPPFMWAETKKSKVFVVRTSVSSALNFPASASINQ